MEHPLVLPSSRHPFRSVATAAVVWAVVAVPVAAVVASVRVFVWVIFALPEMATTAAVLGASEASGCGWLANPKYEYGHFEKNRL